MLASFQQVGNWPRDRDLLNIEVNDGASSDAHSLIMNVGKLSGPFALLESRDCSRGKTCEILRFKSSRQADTSLPNSGGVSASACSDLLKVE